MGKTTNKLLAIAAAAIAGRREEYIRQIQDLRDYHSREARQVTPLDQRAELDRTLDEHFQELTELVKGLAVLGELTPRSIDAISSYGERLSSVIVTLAFQRFGMNAVPLDSRRVIVTDKRHTQAAPDFPETYARLAATIPAMARENVVVMAGFIGSTIDGVTTTLAAAAPILRPPLWARASALKKSRSGPTWTACSPPTPPSSPRPSRQNHSFAEAAELAYFGAKVLHPPRSCRHSEEHPRADPEFAAARSARTRIIARPSRAPTRSSPSPASARSRW